MIVVNPRAGARSGRRRVERLAELLTESGLRPEIVDDARQLDRCVERSLRDGELRCVVAAGGDGTAAMVVNNTAAGVPMSIFPLGTENLLAKYLGTVANPAQAARTIGVGATVALDAGRAGRRIFLLMASCGFDAEVVRRLHGDRTGHIRHLSYVKPIVQTIRKYEYPELRVQCGDGVETISSRWAFVFNLPCYAFGLKIAPAAVGTDGLLDVCTFRHGSLWKGLTYLGGVVLGRHAGWKDCQTMRTPRVHIESDSPVPFELDGDPAGMLPVDIEIVPNRLLLMVPESWASKQGFQIDKSSQIDEATRAQ